MIGGPTNEMDAQIFYFNVSQTGGGNITVEWEGIGHESGAGHTNITIWNWSSQDWVLLNLSDWTDSNEEVYTEEITKDPFNFINKTDPGNEWVALYVGAQNTLGLFLDRGRFCS
jgi:hypothetical protein